MTELAAAKTQNYFKIVKNKEENNQSQLTKPKIKKYHFVISDSRFNRSLSPTIKKVDNFMKTSIITLNFILILLKGPFFFNKEEIENIQIKKFRDFSPKETTFKEKDNELNFHHILNLIESQNKKNANKFYIQYISL